MKRRWFVVVGDLAVEVSREEAMAEETFVVYSAASPDVAIEAARVLGGEGPTLNSTWLM